MYKLDSKEAAHIANHFWIMEKARLPEKHLFIDYAKGSYSIDTINCPQPLKKWVYQATLSVYWGGGDLQ